MNITDLLALALRNLRQALLRTGLTVMGVIVGVAAIITMVSFGLGLQNNIIRDALSRLDLFTTITVSGISVDALLEMNESRSAQTEQESPAPSPAASPEPSRILDDAALVEIEKIPGVRFAVPQVSFSCFLQFEGKTRRRQIGGVSSKTERIPGFKKFLAGQGFSGDDASEIIVGENFDENFLHPPARNRRGPFAQRREPEKTEAERMEAAAKMIGKDVTLLTMKEVEPTSIFGIPLMTSKTEPTPRPPDTSGDKSKIPDSLAGRGFERHVFRIIGVLPSNQRSFIPFASEPSLLIPVEQAKRFAEANRDTVSQVGEALAGDSGYRQVTVQVIDPTQTQIVHDELKQRGFNVFPLPNLDEIKRIFLFVDGALALIGGIALLVASFGISNTMIMSIRERTREIGIMKAIGGSNAEIMKIFFFEASLIGFLGGFLGVVAGWVIASIANPVVNKYVVKSATTYIQFFSIPWYLWIGAILFAMLIALVAALYPASQAANVDPIRALRHD